MAPLGGTRRIQVKVGSSCEDLRRQDALAHLHSVLHHSHSIVSRKVFRERCESRIDLSRRVDHTAKTQEAERKRKRERETLVR